MTFPLSFEVQSNSLEFHLRESYLLGCTDTANGRHTRVWYGLTRRRRCLRVGVASKIFFLDSRWLGSDLGQIGPIHTGLGRIGRNCWNTPISVLNWPIQVKIQKKKKSGHFKVWGWCERVLVCETKRKRKRKQVKYKQVKRKRTLNKFITFLFYHPIDQEILSICLIILLGRVLHFAHVVDS